ncbi:hypothetical protein SAMN05443639_11956 [Stigmatella erecta]|uniref:Uncharacterized protein n=1 Tax=Stigmatella erecta TaxID=83460 RepID=A0A1I0L4C0_9BACT|nr:hypothetical protein SAMN05443639_11956 [Stigmatella erecta]
MDSWQETLSFDLMHAQRFATGLCGRMLPCRAPHIPRCLPLTEGCIPRGRPYLRGMFFFFSNKLGCLGSVAVSLALSGLLYFLFFRAG